MAGSMQHQTTRDLWETSRTPGGVKTKTRGVTADIFMFARQSLKLIMTMILRAPKVNVVTGVEQFEVPSAAEASLPENWELRTSRSSGSGPGGDRARS